MSTTQNEELLDGTATSWLANETPQDYATDLQGRGSLLSTIGMPRWNHEQVILGSVPSWLEAPRVVIFSSRGFTLPEDGFSYWLEVPTFRSPTHDARLLFALKITEEQSEFRGDDAEVLVGRRAGARYESGVADRDRDRGAERR